MTTHLGRRRFRDGVEVKGCLELDGSVRAVRGAESDAGAPATLYQGSHAPWESTSAPHTTTFVMPGIASNYLTVTNYAAIQPGWVVRLWLRLLSNNGDSQSVDLAAGTDFDVGSSNAETAANLAAALNGITGPVDGPEAVALGNRVALRPSANTILCGLWAAGSQSAAWAVPIHNSILNVGTGFDGTVTARCTINLGTSGDLINLGATLGTHRIVGVANYGSTGGLDFRVRQAVANTWEVAHAADRKTSWSPSGMAHTLSAVGLANGQSSFAVPSNIVSVSGDSGGNEVSAVTLGGAAVNADYTRGMEVSILFTDGNVSVVSTPYAERAANEIYLGGGNYDSTPGGTLTIIRDAVGWVEKCRT